MARIYLLFSLASVLALGSVFLSVSGHAPPVTPRKSACPKTVSELQTLPFTEITEILNRKERSAPKTPEFKAMFTMCKGYVTYLESLYKFENPIVDVLGIAKTRYTLMNKAILAAQASVGGKVNKKTSLKLKKSYADLTKGFLRIKETIVKISAKHDYQADAKITAHEAKKLNHAMISFKNSINAFMNVVNNLENKKMKKIGLHARALGENREKVRNAFKSFFKKFGGYLGGKTHRRELTEAKYNADSHVGADVKGFESIIDKFSDFFNGYLGGHRRELFYQVPAGEFADEKIAIHASLDAKAHGRKGIRRELYAQAPLFKNFFNVGFGGKAQYDAAGKMKVAGDDGFRSLNRAHVKHFASTEA